MKAKKTIVVALCMFLLALMLGVGTGIYYYTHPLAVKRLAEKTVLRTTGAAFSIEHLTYSLNPIRIKAKGIVFESPDGSVRISSKIKEVVAECVLDGSFGRKTLVCKIPRVNGFECRVKEGASLAPKAIENEESSFLGSMVKFGVSFFLFKDFKLEAIEIGGGVLTAQWNGRQIQLSGLSGHLNADHLLDIRGDILVASPTENATLSIPDFHLETNGAISFTDPRLDFTIAFLNGGFQSPEVNMKNMGAKAMVHYDHGEQAIAVPDLHFTVGEARLKRSPQTEKTPMDIRLEAAGHVAIEGPISNLRLSGQVEADNVAFQGMGLSATSAGGTARFSGTYPVFNITDFSCRIPHVKSLMGKRTFSVEQIEIDAPKGWANVLTQTLNFSEIKIQSSLFKNLFIAFQRDNGEVTFTIKGKQTELTRAAMALKLLPTGWTFQGTDAIEIEAALEKKGGISFSSTLALEKFAFQNFQQTRMGENISIRARVSGRMTFPDLTVKAVAAIEADKGEVLLDRFYFDLKETGFFVNCDGTYSGPLKRIMLEGLSLGIKKIAAAHMTGTLVQTKDDYEGNLSLEIPDTPLKGAFHRLVREPFQTENPSLTALTLDGVLSAKMTLEGNFSHWITHGFCVLKKGSLSYGKRTTLTGIALSLPLWLTSGVDKGLGQQLKGGLWIRSMRGPFLPEQSLNIPILAESNGLSVPIAVDLTVPGGHIRIGPSTITGLIGNMPTIHSALHFEDLQMEPVLKIIWPRSVQGVADGNLNPIHITAGKLSSVGEIKATVFNGECILSDLGATGLLTPLPVFSLNARWHDLNLAEITQDTSFGKIDGILNGYANNLEISNGQLQGFDLLLQTVKTEGVPQKISVKAVDNIARLGGGQSPFIGVAGMFVSLFKEFSYEQIGVQATLQNDVFRIHGTIRENGKEYLVKRGFFSGVDVINQSKDNRVGFKDMLKRIKRITDAKSGPVIR